MSTSIDMATALELRLDDENEAKFTALKSLNMKKMKAMMASIESKDREIAKLKILSKDNRRAQMIQELRKKIRTHETINDLLKEELHRRAELTQEETNDMIIRKTLAGPKRFRPLSREELENKISELEKRLAKKSSGTAAAASSSAGVHDSEAQEKTSKAAHEEKRERGGSEIKSDSKDRTAADVAVAGENISKLVALVEEVDELKRQIIAKDHVLDHQRDEIVRLKARNAQLVAVEEEIDLHERQYQHLKSMNSSLESNLQEATIRLAAALESSMKLKSDLLIDKEDHHSEIVSLQKECEKLLKQNAMLLRSIGDFELEVETLKKDGGELNKMVTGLQRSIEQKNAEIAALKEKVARNDEKTRTLEGKIAALEAEMEQIPLLKNQLREKNIQIKDMKRNIGVRDQVARSAGSALPADVADAKDANTTATDAVSNMQGESPDAKAHIAARYGHDSK